MVSSAFSTIIYHSLHILSPDIDECQIVPSVCHSDADCTDSDGSYECTCREGYTGNETHCTGNIVRFSYEFLYCFHVLNGITRDAPHCIFPDIDECMESPCHVNANCTNTKGSFNCECNIGYTGDGMNCSSMFTLLFLPLLFNLEYY